jgi:hypothetical protein
LREKFARAKTDGGLTESRSILVMWKGSCSICLYLRQVPYGQGTVFGAFVALAGGTCEERSESRRGLR